MAVIAADDTEDNHFSGDRALSVPGSCIGNPEEGAAVLWHGRPDTAVAWYLTGIKRAALGPVCASRGPRRIGFERISDAPHVFSLMRGLQEGQP